MNTKIRRKLRPSWVVLAITFVFLLIFTISKFTDSQASKATEDNDTLKAGHPIDTAYLSKFKNAQENENCLKCHG